MSEVVYEAPWLELEPMFYNVRTGAVDRDVSAVIDLPEVELDPEGLSYYLDLGYSAFGRTPVRDVRYVEAATRLLRGPGGGFSVEPTAAAGRVPGDGTSSVDEVLDAMRGAVAAAVAGTSGPVVIPTSGGKDSRMLNALVRELGLGDRVWIFTYGLSDDQSRCDEVVRAREVARRVGARWERIQLGEQHHYMRAWYDWFGPAVEAHGMYQIEFYRGIAARLGEGAMREPPLVLSGAFGDWFAGQCPESLTLPAAWTGPDDVVRYFRQGPEHATSAASALPVVRDAAEEALEESAAVQRDPRLRFLTKARTRTMLLRYLVDVPRRLGFAAAAPLADERAGLAALSLPLEDRLDYRWELRTLAEAGLDVDGDAYAGDRMNTLDVQALHRVPLRPLDVDVLRECIRPDYVRWVNRDVGRLGRLWEMYWRSATTKGLRRVNAWLRARGLEAQQLPAYYAYLVLWPLQQLLQARDAARTAAATGDGGGVK